MDYSRHIACNTGVLITGTGREPCFWIIPLLGLQLAAAIGGTVRYLLGSTCIASYLASTHSPDVIGGYSGS